MSLVRINDLHFSYKSDPQFSLNIANLHINRGDRLFIEGPSGCGKTTFLNLITGLQKSKQGHIRILDLDIATLRTSQCDRFRADHFGIIFQLFNLIPYLSVVENILLPCAFSTARKNKASQTSSSLEMAAERLCSELDIGIDLQQKPVNRLSIGQQQRVAIARALIGQPEIIVADEPTSALDDIRKAQFMNLLLSECQSYDTTLIFVSHDTSLKSYFDNTYPLNQAENTKTEPTYVAV